MQGRERHVRDGESNEREKEIGRKDGGESKRGERERDVREGETG